MAKTTCVLLLLVSPLCHALPTDRMQVMTFQADSADINQTEHRGIYTGTVELNQGTMHVRAASVLTNGNEKNQLINAIATGDKTVQAHYWVTTAINKPDLHAYADEIRYYPDRHLIELIGHAKVIQGDNSYLATKITYDTLHQHVMSKGDPNHRTEIIIHPEEKK